MRCQIRHFKLDYNGYCTSSSPPDASSAASKRSISSGSIRIACCWTIRGPGHLATVGASNRRPVGRSTRNASRMRPAIRVAWSDWPPSSRKRSYTPTVSSDITSRQIAARTLRLDGRARGERRASRAWAVRRRWGPAPCDPPCRCAERHRAPAGRCAPAAYRSGCVRPSAAATPRWRDRRDATTYVCMVGPSAACRATTAAWLTPGRVRSVASISDSSTRWPPSFTCESARPTSCSLPSGRSMPRSPVR